MLSGDPWRVRFPARRPDIDHRNDGRWNIPISHGENKDAGEVYLTKGVIHGDAFSPLVFVLMIDLLIKTIKIEWVIASKSSSAWTI